MIVGGHYAKYTVWGISERWCLLQLHWLQWPCHALHYRGLQRQASAVVWFVKEALEAIASVLPAWWANERGTPGWNLIWASLGCSSLTMFLIFIWGENIQDFLKTVSMGITLTMEIFWKTKGGRKSVEYGGFKELVRAQHQASGIKDSPSKSKPLLYASISMHMYETWAWSVNCQISWVEIWQQLVQRYITPSFTQHNFTHQHIPPVISWPWRLHIFHLSSWPHLKLAHSLSGKLLHMQQRHRRKKNLGIL